MTQISTTDNPNWWREAIIYQVYPRSFLDTNGDGVGDLTGMTAKLDYIASLGVDIVWLSPFFKSPMNDFGYDIADYCDVDPLFGDLADFDRMVAKAHSLGLKIMIDQVMSHTADDPHVVRRKPRQPRQSEVRLVCVGRPAPGRQPAQQLAVGVRRLVVAVGHPPQAVLPAQLPRQPAAAELPQSAGAAGPPRCAAFLARARRRRRAHGCVRTSTSTTASCAAIRRR